MSVICIDYFIFIVMPSEHAEQLNVEDNGQIL